MNTHWSGVIVAEHQATRRVHQIGNETHVIFDVEAGDLPGTIWWPHFSGPPIPTGWRAVVYDFPSGRVMLARRRWAPPIRVYVVTRAYLLWLRALGPLARTWWQRRPTTWR